MNQKTIGIIAIAAVVIIGGYFLLTNKSSDSGSQNSQNNGVQQQMPAPGNEQVPEMVVQGSDENVITFTDTGYSPSTITIKAGESVTFKNNSSKSMWPASAMHPAHVVYSGTPLSEHCPDVENVTFDACTGIPVGSSWTFTFNKVGAWGFHDHLSPSFFGKITVE